MFFIPSRKWVAFSSGLIRTLNESGTLSERILGMYQQQSILSILFNGSSLSKPMNVRHYNPRMQFFAITQAF